MLTGVTKRNASDQLESPMKKIKLESQSSQESMTRSPRKPVVRVPSYRSQPKIIQIKKETDEDELDTSSEDVKNVTDLIEAANAITEKGALRQIAVYGSDLTDRQPLITSRRVDSDKTLGLVEKNFFHKVLQSRIVSNHSDNQDNVDMWVGALSFLR